MDEQGRRDVAIFVERFLPPSQAFVLKQADAYRRYDPRFLVIRRIADGHASLSAHPVVEVNRETAPKKVARKLQNVDVNRGWKNAGDPQAVANQYCQMRGYRSSSSLVSGDNGGNGTMKFIHQSGGAYRMSAAALQGAIDDSPSLRKLMLGYVHSFMAQVAGTALANASHILGYMYLDGEGVVADTGEAVKWLKVAHKYGCKEASRVLGGLFRNGQY